MHHRNDHIALDHPMFCQNCGQKCTGSSMLARHFLDDHPQDETLTLWARYLSGSPAKYLPRDIGVFMTPPESVAAASSSNRAWANPTTFESIPQRSAYISVSASTSALGPEVGSSGSWPSRVPHPATRTSEPLFQSQGTPDYDDRSPQTGWLCRVDNCNTEHHSRRLLMKHQMMDHPNEPMPVAESVPEQSPKPQNSAFECRVEGCNKRFSCSSMLTRHKYTHEPPRFKCPHCSALLSRPDALTRHLKSSCR
ncbi:hypothetical protein BS47DRAFT_675313 [Hydnum rufescens UP504]|uniref:C2H2-type domain-containing protein n=1 Tax=Hydnum rufescens UP504 TaxID=1448309 RepID=A0A9P6DZT9_9AGAM|nr:hypothetical protein BS47DRAFT_675313 [Hydnum rufescens UP504]